MTEPSNLCQMSAVQQNNLFRTGKASARELLDAHLSRIDDVNSSVNAVVSLDPSVAEATAKDLDERHVKGERFGPGAGIVTAFKDLSDTSQFVTTYGSPAFANHRPTEDALVVQRMRAAGMVAVGKSNTPELGAGSHTFNPVFGITRNPYNLDLSAGGSSGGAAVALRTGMVGLADGSDLGGSLRNPAGWNNVVGFRPSARVVSVGGGGNFWNPMPISGPMARNVDDLALLLSIMSAPTLGDPLHQDLKQPRTVDPPKGRLRVAWSKDLGGLPVESDVARVLDRFKDDVGLVGWDLTEAEPDFSGADETFVTLRAFMYLEKADAMSAIKGELKKNVQDEIDRGLGYSANDIVKAYAHLGVLWQRGVEFFKNFDLLVAPVSQVSPFPVELENPESINGQPMESYLHWMLSCCRITTFGLPALSLPAGFTDSGLPVGAQLIGPPQGDVALLQAAKALEAATGYGAQGPDLGLLAQ